MNGIVFYDNHISEQTEHNMNSAMYKNAQWVLHSRREKRTTSEKTAFLFLGRNISTYFSVGRSKNQRKTDGTHKALDHWLYGIWCVDFFLDINRMTLPIECHIWADWNSCISHLFTCFVGRVRCQLTVSKRYNKLFIVGCGSRSSIKRTKET